MSVDLAKLVSKRVLNLEELRDRTVAIDAYNVIYQFLSIIRGPDGNQLADIHGNVTSHLSGLFYRSIDLLGYGIKPIYVFDGIPSVLKQKTIAARMQRRRAAYEAWQEAKARGAVEEARAHAQASTRITKEVVASAKDLLGLMAIPYVSAPGEGEAQASRMCANGQAYAVGSQDYDTMLFGAPLVVRNLTLSGRRKLPGKHIYVNVEPELMSLDGTLGELGISQRQLIWLGILLGTDFNEGVVGVGPKTALKIVKGAATIEDIKNYVKSKYNAEFELDIREVESLFLNPETSEIDDSSLRDPSTRVPNKESIIKFLCDQHDFGHERIGKFADKLIAIKSSAGQSGMSRWLK